MRRRAVVLSLLGSGLSGAARSAAPDGPEPAPLQFPKDFGAHPETRTEWWYATGMLEAGARLWGFQITFFRTATGIAAQHPSRFAASQLIFAHAALTDLERKRLRHDERIARSGFGIAKAATGDTDVVLDRWTFHRDGGIDTSRYTAHVPAGRSGFGFDLRLQATQPLLLQGVAGYSRKGPRPGQSSRYYSQPQLAVDGTLSLEEGRVAVQGRAWLDHEWSDAYLDPDAPGWDWIGMNLDDGSALMAFRIRRRDGGTLYAGGSFRRPGEAARNFASAEVVFTPGRRWTSPNSKATYPVEWTVDTPAGRFGVRALLDDQELDSRAATASIYWEGLSDLLDAQGRRVGRGYLEMTGYAAPLAM